MKYSTSIFSAGLVLNEVKGQKMQHFKKHSDPKKFFKAIKMYQEKYNRPLYDTGAFWNERFGSRIIKEADNPENYLLWLLRYIG